MTNIHDNEPNFPIDDDDDKDFFDASDEDNHQATPESPLKTPYDFRAEYQERITTTVPVTESVDKRFSSIRVHAVGIGVLIGVLVAVLLSVLIWDNTASSDKTPVVVASNDEAFKHRPDIMGGMPVPDQDKLVYKRMRSDDVDIKVESLFPQAESPIEPVAPEDKAAAANKVAAVPDATKEAAGKSTKEGQVLGAEPLFVPAAAMDADADLEVLPVLTDAAIDLEAPIEPVASVTESMPATAPVPVVAPSPKKAAPKAASAAAPIKGGAVWYVQLASMPAKNSAHKAWASIMKAHAALLSGLPHDVVPVSIKGKGTFYRLRVGQFSTRESAKALCNKLKVRGQDCTLTK